MSRRLRALNRLAQREIQSSLGANVIPVMLDVLVVTGDSSADA